MWNFIGEEQRQCLCPGKKTIHTYMVYQKGNYKAFYLGNEINFGEYLENGTWFRTQKGFILRAGAPRFIE